GRTRGLEPFSLLPDVQSHRGDAAARLSPRPETQASGGISSDVSGFTDGHRGGGGLLRLAASGQGVPSALREVPTELSDSPGERGAAYCSATRINFKARTLNCRHSRSR